MTSIKLFHQDGEEKREYTEDEYAQNAKDILQIQNEKLAEETKLKKMETDKATLLAKLGITADEAKLLLS